LEAFPDLEALNDLGLDIDKISSNAHFYILRSSNDDNIHKAIKYHMWSTTNSGKAILSNAWKEAEKRGEEPEIYLIFSVVNSHHVLGVAKMTSDIRDTETFMYWWEPMKWFGSFQLKWLFIKDIHYSKFEHIKEETSGSSSFINLKDSTKLSVESGKEVLRIFKDYVATSNIFGSFAYMDRREDYIRLQRDNNSYFLTYFEECCSAYQKDPEGFSPVKKSQYNKRGGKYNGSNYSSGYSKRQGNTYYRKTYATKQFNATTAYYPKRSQNSTNTAVSNNNNKVQPNLSAEEYPPLSLAEQFGFKAQNKKTKLQKPKKNEVEGEKTEGKAEESALVNN
jgi:hypothetical protein